MFERPRAMWRIIVVERKDVMFKISAVEKHALQCSSIQNERSLVCAEEPQT
jgi:hypothetical protein